MLTNDQKRIKIAEACGWKRKDADSDMMGKRWYRVQDDGKLVQRGSCPDYFNDLNAMHEASAILRPEHYEKWRDELSKSVFSERKCLGMSKYEFEFWMSQATATQRAEAFGRTLNLW